MQISVEENYFYLELMLVVIDKIVDEVDYVVDVIFHLN